MDDFKRQLKANYLRIAASGVALTSVLHLSGHYIPKTLTDSGYVFGFLLCLLALYGALVKVK